MSQLERFPFDDDRQPECPLCGGLLSELREVAADLQRQHIAVVGRPCRCDLTEHAARLQQAAIQAGQPARSA